jgi:hypothetical protein
MRHADGEGVWSWHPWAGAKPARRIAGDGDYEVTDTGESAHNAVNTVAQGRPGVSVEPVVNNSCASFAAHEAAGAASTRFGCTRGCGCSQHPVFPAPSVFERDDVDAKLGRIPPRGCGRTSLRTVIASGAKQSRVTREALDCFRLRARALRRIPARRSSRSERRRVVASLLARTKELGCLTSQIENRRCASLMQASDTSPCRKSSRRRHICGPATYRASPRLRRRIRTSAQAARRSDRRRTIARARCPAR